MKKHPVDLQGIHFCTGCNMQGVRIHTHDRVRDLLAKIISYCGIGIRKEQRNAFRGADPDSNLRSDITVYGIPSRGHGTYHIDLRITSPVPANNRDSLTCSQAAQSFRAGNQALREKINKYEVIVEKNQMKFIPVVFELSGKLDDGFRHLLKEILHHASNEKQIPFGCLWKYWISTLMICMQRHLVEGIQTRTYALNGRGFKDTYETSRGVIQEIDYLARDVENAQAFEDP